MWFTTAVVLSALGRQRKRVFASLHTLGCFRIYLDPHALVKHVRRTARQAGIHHHSFDDDVLPAVIQVTSMGPVVTGGIMGADAGEGGVSVAGGEGGDDESVDFEDITSLGSEVPDSMKTFTSREQFTFLAGHAAGGYSNAADLLAQRTPDIRSIVYVLENFYSLIGIRHLLARAHALFAVQGYAENTAIGMASTTLATSNFPALIPELQRVLRRPDEEDDSTAVRQDKAKEADQQIRRIQQLAAARAMLEQAVAARCGQGYAGAGGVSSCGLSQLTGLTDLAR